jgi:F1F0 ATPase subunit 2
MTIANDAVTAAWAPLLVGMGLGACYCGALWWTVQRLATARRPTLLALGSMAVRLAAMVAGFHWIMDGQWMRLLACTGGFLAVRTILVGRAAQAAGGVRYDRRVR